MITTGFDARVKIQQIVENQLPEFIISETPKASEFLKQYYISQEFQGGPVDIAENLDQYKKLNNLTPEVISGISTLTSYVGITSSEIYVDNTKGFPSQYGLFKLDDEIITYTGITTNSFTGCKRGFSGIVTYHHSLNPEELGFSTSKSATHEKGTRVENLSSLFLKEFYNKLKKDLTPGFENVDFVSGLNVNNFIKESRTFYQSKGTDDSFRILYNVLYGVDPKVLDLKEFLLRSSDAEFVRREVLVTELVSGSNPNNLVGQVIKSSDDTASAPVSEVEIISRGSTNYYKIQLFAGFNEKSLIEGTFTITPKTKVLENISVGSSVITVDSTIGFDKSGTLISGSNVIKYTEKTINQFLGCTGVNNLINIGSNIRTDKLIYGYENGDTSKKVELRITGVLSELENQNDIYFRDIGDTISVKHIGEKIENPDVDKTYKQTIFNSWIYNTKTRYEVQSFNNNQVTLYELPDKSSLKVGDTVNVLSRNSENVILENAIVALISNKVITLDQNISGIPSNTKISIRKNLKYASSSGLSLKYPNLTVNVQNTYDENSENLYVASNSLPDYTINKNITFETINITSSTNLDTIFISPKVSETDGKTKYSILSFTSQISFITGDEVIYTGSSTPITGLNFNQSYYVEVVVPSNPSDIKNKIRLYNARSFIGTNNYIEFEKLSSVSTHTFTLSQHNGGKKLTSKKILKRIPLNPNIKSGTGTKTIPGSVGVMINGVDIVNYKSDDKIYYGPLENLKVINSGSDYDVLTPPTVLVSNPKVGVGTTALVNLVVNGNIKEVIVDPNEIEVERVLSSYITGGNGSGAILDPIVETKFREIPFNGRTSDFGGGVNVVNDTVTFLEFHKLQNGTPIVYNSNGNSELGIGTFGGSNTDQDRYLVNGGIYYPEIINTSSIKLFNTLSDFNSGINTIGFTTANAGGIHKFRLLNGKRVLTEIRVEDGGSNYENRSLIVKPTGISTISDTVYFKNHGFKNGDLINYKIEPGFGAETPTAISGLSTSNQYYILKIDDSNFRLSNAGLSSTSPSSSNFDRNKYVKFESTGTGKQIFKYPEIQLNIEAEYSGTVGVITATPIIRGSVVDAYLYESGSDYGSSVLNFHKKPILTIKKGYSAQLKPIILDSKIVGVEIQNSGLNYTSSPDLIVNGDGLGAKLRAVVTNGSISKVIIVNGGTNYNSNNTTIKVQDSGKNCTLDCDVRSLTVNNYARFSDQILTESGDDLSYGVVGYSTNREGISFLDHENGNHSKIIGWCLDGNPIYGPYGFSDPKNKNSQINLLKSGYTKSLSNVENRPSEFSLGFFVEDHIYSDSGDLDISNGRFCVTPEFPNGTYAYFVGVSTNITTNTLESEFPYFIGDQYRSNFEIDSSLSQNFDFNNSNLIRNTFPYRVNQNYSNNDFIIESNKISKQVSIVESISDGSVEDFEIVVKGDGYKVNQSLVFDNTDTNGGGASAIIKSISGKQIKNIETTIESYENALVTRINSNQIEIKIDPYHNLLNGDTVQIVGVSTNKIKNLNGSHPIGVTSETASVLYEIPLNSTVGLVTDIYVSPIPNNVSIGTTIGIGTEILSVLNVFGDLNILRVSRGITGLAHTSGSLVNFYPNKIIIDLKTDYFDSKENTKIYFNPNYSVSVGLNTGTSTNIQTQIGIQTVNISVENQSIYIPNHPFKTNQRVLLVKPTGSSSLQVRDTPTSSLFNIPSGISTHVYIINKTKDTIGIVTEVGLTTTTNGLFFSGNGSDNYNYYLQPTFNEVTTNVKKVVSRVSVSTSHGLSYGDTISLVVKPGLTTGIGTTASSVVVRYNSIHNKILINPIGFSSEKINTNTNIINISSHGLKTGDKVFYNSYDLVSSGLSTGDYFVNKVDSNNIQLCETYNDSISYPPIVVSVGSSGGSLHEISQINPQLKVVKNNDIVFNLSHNSLLGYKFKIYYDGDFKNEFVSTGSTTTFSTFYSGVVGVNTTSSLTLNYDENLPETLFYNLEKSGEILTADSDVKDHSKITFINSTYSGEYTIFGIGNTTFNISLLDEPEKNSYIGLGYTTLNSDCEVLEYSTTSKTATGGIDEIELISEGFGYTKLPIVVGVTTLSLGSNAIIKTKSTNIGKIEQLRLLNEGFEFSSDKTLKPKADVSRLLRLERSDKIVGVAVSYGGKNLISPPLLSLVNNRTRKKVSSGLLNPKLSGNAITEVLIIEEPKGLESVEHSIFIEKNSNGVGVERILSYNKATGIVEVELTTPAVNGFVNPPFKIDDYIFVEGLVKESTTDELGITTSPGTGFNSSDNGYNFFKVTDYVNEIPARLSYFIGEFTNNAGTLVGIQSYFNSIVNRNNYPIFVVNQIPSIFNDGEKLLVNQLETDLVVEKSSKNLLKISGDYKVKYDDLIYGVKSGNIARVNENIQFSSNYKVDYSSKKTLGWKNDTGKLNNNYQVLPDNDYYQNLAYSIKTSGENYKQNKVLDFDTVKDSVNRLVHPTGLKNFVDVGITSSVTIGIGSDQSLSQVLDFVSEERVDTFNNFDLSLDYLPTSTSSDAVIFKNKKLADYIECLSNRVLQIDDISPSFSSAEFNKDTFIDAYEYSITDQFSKFLIQVVDENKTTVQASELVILNNYDNTYTMNKADLYTGDNLLGDFSGSFAQNGNSAVKFTPTDPLGENYNLKIYRDYFSTDSSTPGIGFTDLGFLRLTGRVENFSTSGITTDIFKSQISTIDTVYSNVFIRNNDTLDMNYFEILAFHDGQNSYVSEYCFDTENNISGSSFGFIGTFGTSLDGGVLKLNFTNNTSNSVTVKAKTVGFGTTASGTGSYRYLVGDQVSGTEKTARLESSHQVSIGNTVVTSYTLGVESTLKSLVRVGVGSTVALHQFLVISDSSRVNIQRYPFLSVGSASTSGIGTFGVETDGVNVFVKFFPDSMFSSSSLEIRKFNQFIYFDTDEINQPETYKYGVAIEDIDTAFYGGLNIFGKDRLSFNLNYQGTPIFEKTFNPGNSAVLNQSTGVFTIVDHFFQTGEELIYTPSSTLPGITPSPVGIGTTLVGGVTFVGDFISGFSTVTGIAATTGFNIGDTITGTSVASGTTITSIGSTFTYFIGDVIGGGSTVITGIANTSVLSIGSSIFNLSNTGIGSIVSIGINSITSSQVVTAGTGVTFYSNNLKTSITLSNVSTGTTFRNRYVTGIVTSICPTRVYAIKISKDTFKISGTSGESAIGFTFTSSGSGNAHQLEMKKKNEKSLITINGVNQYPIIWTPINYTLQNNGGTVGSAVTFIALSGISSIAPRDLIKIDDEYVRVVNVGLGTTSSGPVTGLGTIPIVQVDRGFVGSSATSHIDGSPIRIYRGSYNIVGNKIHFTEAPDGKGNNNRLDFSGLPVPRSTFNGRVFLRKDYTFNKIYDDISEKFTGIGRTFNLTLEGENTSGIEPGSGLVFINDVFQTPDTENNSGNNYTLTSSSTLGITTVTFTSITRPNTNDVIIVPYDVNQNQVPRGGIPITIGSTGGLGYAPLVGASVTAVLGVGGSITAVGVGTTDISGSGYQGGTISIGVTDSVGFGATITATVGAGGTLSFNVINGGSGYVSPKFNIDSPSYENLSIIGVSRLSIGDTTATGIGLSITVNVQESSVTGIGTSFFAVKSFTITKPGYGFNRGDKFKVVGLVTAKGLSQPIEELILNIDETFTDSFACWQLGELDYIDNIKFYQNGIRKRFPLIRNGSLLSFEKKSSDVESNEIDFNSILLIYLNGVMQEPGISYNFDGGTTFTFVEAPKQEDNVAIFFYRGTRGVDSSVIDVNESVKPGDIIKINKNDFIPNTFSQSERIVSLIQSADVVETGIYLGDGIDENNYKPLDWTKQKEDLVINGDYIFKSRDSLEAIVVPATRVIKNINSTDTEIFVDDAQFFKYEENDTNTSINIQRFSGLLIDSSDEPISAGFTAIVSVSSTISSIGILTAGRGYTPNSTITLKIGNPIGVGSTATATASVSSSGIVTSVNITNPGSGYTSSNPPSILPSQPSFTDELISSISFAEGFSGIITGISTSSGTGSNPTAIKFNISHTSASQIDSLLVGYPIVVTQTNIGSAITSINSSDNDTVGIGITFFDNIYIVNAISRTGLVGVITCNVLSSSSISGIQTSGEFCGRFSWGRLYGITRSSNPVSVAVSGYTVNSGLTTFPQIVRRGYGLRDGGGLKKQLI